MLRIPNTSSCALIGLALCLPMLVALVRDDQGRESASNSAVLEQAEQAEQEDPLRGMWMRYDSRGEGDPLRFWYFHGDGKGLYRYGKVGLANTHSFDYALTRSDAHDANAPIDLSLRFRKRGESHTLIATIDKDGQGTWLSFTGDPREPGARYRKVELSRWAWGREGVARPAALETDLDPGSDAPTAASASGIGDRMWIDYRNLATGGAEFHLYQLAATAIDGRGVGWFHRGDFDDWSTESLTYRIDGDRLELFFDLREEPNSTGFRVVEGEHGRELWLDADPRDFWAAHRYRDGGRGLRSAAFDVVADVQRWSVAER